MHHHHLHPKRAKTGGDDGGDSSGENFIAAPCFASAAIGSGCRQSTRAAHCPPDDVASSTEGLQFEFARRNPWALETQGGIVGVPGGIACGEGEAAGLVCEQPSNKWAHRSGCGGRRRRRARQWRNAEVEGHVSHLLRRRQQVRSLCALHVQWIHGARASRVSSTVASCQGAA